MAKNISDAVERSREAFNSGKTRCIDFRATQLQNLLDMVEKHEDEMHKCLEEDLQKSRFESILFETGFLKNDLRNNLENLENWVKPKSPSKPLANVMDDVKIYNEPYGLVLIIGAWNFPFQLLLVPFASAIAAGNCVVLKPSEISSHSAKFLNKYIPQYLDPDCYTVINGGVDETTELLQKQFDYIFFTGSPKIGKIVYEAATKFLTPVTLELGGKSPCYIDSTADIKITVKRVLWGKLINCGQTCIAPDYILCTKEVEQEFIKEASNVIKKWYGCDTKQSPDLCRIVNANNFKRLINMIKSAKKIAIGGNYNENERYFEPTVLVDVSADDPVMQEEIFGPILPIVSVDNLHNAIDFINSREKPLALYMFSSSKESIDLMVNNVSCGGVCINDTILHASVQTLPFGGIGQSGMGNYHGEYGFDTFSHKKSCLKRSFNLIGEYLGAMRYPPYTEQKLSSLNSLFKKRKSLPKIPFTHILAFVTGYVFKCVYQHFLYQKSEGSLS